MEHKIEENKMSNVQKQEMLKSMNEEERSKAELNQLMVKK